MTNIYNYTCPLCKNKLVRGETKGADQYRSICQKCGFSKFSHEVKIINTIKDISIVTFINTNQQGVKNEQ